MAPTCTYVYVVNLSDMDFLRLHGKTHEIISTPALPGPVGSLAHKGIAQGLAHLYTEKCRISAEVGELFVGLVAVGVTMSEGI